MNNVTKGQIQWILFWCAVFSKNIGILVVWFFSLLFLENDEDKEVNEKEKAQ